MSKLNGYSITSLDRVLALATGGLALLLYWRTLIPGLLTGDGGEFQSLVYLLGHTHPTGYPVYLALGKLFTLLPLGEIAYRVNLFSAVMAAVAVAGVYLAGQLLTNYRAIALVGALALAISPTFWSQAIIAEVYTTGAAFFIWIIVALLCWDLSLKKSDFLKKTDFSWSLFSAGLLGGLSLGVHMSVLLLTPAALLFVIAGSAAQKTTRSITTNLLTNLKTAVWGVLCGLVLTVLLFRLIDRRNPKANYFHSVVEPSRSAWNLDAEAIDGPFERLIFGWSARQFRPFMFSAVSEVMPQQAADYWQNLTQEFSEPLLVIAAIGAAALLLRKPRSAILLLVALATQLLFFFNYAIWDLYVFYIPSYILIALLAIAGMAELVDIFARLLAKVTTRLTTRKSVSVLGIFSASLILIFAIWPILEPHKRAISTGEASFRFEEYPLYEENTLLIASATVIDLPPNAIVFTDWDMMWPYYYVALVQHNRSDLTFIETHPADDQEQIAASLLQYVASQAGERPLFFMEREAAVAEAGFKFGPARVGPTRMNRVLLPE